MPKDHEICSTCATKVQCIKCKRKLRAARFTLNCVESNSSTNPVCNACTKKLQTCKKPTVTQGGGGRSSASASSNLDTVFSTHDLETAQESHSVENYLRTRREDIIKILQKELKLKRFILIFNELRNYLHSLYDAGDVPDIVIR